MIETTGLTKRFGKVLAVDGVGLDVREGDVYGFLGANGSGKTTTVRMLLGLVLPTSGEMSLFGERMPRAGRRTLPRVGTLVEGPAAYGHLPAKTNLALLDASGPSSRADRRSRGDRVEAVLDQVGLGGIGGRPVKAFSLGMRQRLGLAAALLRKPDLLVLDEPTNGLDPQGIHEIRDLLLALNAAGTTVFLSSHLLAEIEQMCTRVGVLDRGRLVVQDSLEALRQPTGLVEVVTDDPAAAVSELGARVELRDERRLLVRADDAAALNRQLVAAGVAVTGLAVQRHTLEEVVLARTSAGSDRVAGPTSGTAEVAS